MTYMGGLNVLRTGEKNGKEEQITIWWDILFEGILYSPMKGKIQSPLWLCCCIRRA